ncbi:Sodium-dependent multivitamin transporter [Holothuria leucospilota]|uniref:Sodium-dependent multivitamin transporter n=1 Tax=Holothuria leucospilota TaxID=206669 RepID=A0A9Q1HGT5_HOLLE|nr:Sodium-dependent multivitamin transporter [Holothuria leucospilota]
MYESGPQPLGWLDYVMFILLLVAATLTGLYHNFKKGGQKTTQQFLLADRSVLSLPVAMTLLVSFVSPITLLGTPAEIYHYGGQFMIFVFSALLLYPMMTLIFVPVFYGLKITTAYEYLHKRFGLSLRLLGAFVFTIQTVIYMSIVTYTPALAIEAVTGFAVWKIILLTGLVCTVYTALGGLKAVIYTDVIMFVVIIISMLLVIILGTIRAGGFGYVLEVNAEADRLNILSFPFDPTVRMTFFSVLIGGALNNLSIWAVSQTAVQRFLAAKDLRSAKISVWLNMPFSAILVLVCCLEGLIMYAFYYGDGTLSYATPDPVGVTGEMLSMRSPPNLTSKDQILVYFVSEQFGNIPGFQGLFIACIMAGALSTISSGLNALVSVILIDGVRPFRVWWARRKHSELTTSDRSDTILSKILSVVLGLLSLVLAFFAPYLGTLLKLTNSVFGAAGGPLVGVFLLGMIWKRANEKGTLIGALCGFAMGLWTSMGAIATKDVDPDERLGLYNLSFMWYSGFTLLITVLVSMVMSEIFRLACEADKNHVVNPYLLVPWIRGNLSKYQDVPIGDVVKYDENDRDQADEKLEA